MAEEIGRVIVRALNEQSALVLISLAVAFAAIKLYQMERVDRKEAWKSHNALLQRTLDALNNVNSAIHTLTEIVKDRVR